MWPLNSPRITKRLDKLERDQGIVRARLANHESIDHHTHPPPSAIPSCDPGFGIPIGLDGQPIKDNLQDRDDNEDED